MTDQATNPMRAAIQEAISENPVLLFMKGTPDAPACGFSARTVAALQSLGTQFAAVDILPDPRIRQELSALSNWPTIPQLFVNGELVGGCDIVVEMYQSGELAQTLGLETASPVEEEPEVGRRGPGADEQLAGTLQGGRIAGQLDGHAVRRRDADQRGAADRQPLDRRRHLGVGAQLELGLNPWEDGLVQRPQRPVLEAQRFDGAGLALRGGCHPSPPKAEG